MVDPATMHDETTPADATPDPGELPVRALRAREAAVEPRSPLLMIASDDATLCVDDTCLPPGEAP
jgi:hypothetical protein